MPKKEKKEQEKLAEIQELLKRVQADFENYRKRTQKEKEEFGKFLNTDLILRIIPILDNFKLALKHLPEDLKENSWVEGIWHIERQLEQVLSDEGVTEVIVTGKFNPHLHEAVAEVESEKPPGEITEVIQSGYQIDGKVIRHAKVKVSKGMQKSRIKNQNDN